MFLLRAARQAHIAPVVRHYNSTGFTRYALYQYGLQAPNVVRSTVRRPVSTASAQQSTLTKVRNYLDKDPFIKVSLVFVGVVFAMSLVIEVYLKLQKKKKDTKLRSPVIIPPKPSTAVVNRAGMMSQLSQLVAERQRHSLPSGVLVTGPAGSGKTELLRQHAEQFLMDHHTKSTEKKPQVIVVDANSFDALELSALHGLHLLGLQYLHIAEHLKSHQPATFANKCQYLLHLLVTKMKSCAHPCLLIINDVTDKTLSCCESALQQDGDVLQVVAASSSAMVSKRMKGIDVPVLDMSSGFSEAEALQLLHFSSRNGAPAGLATAQQKERLLNFVRNTCSLPLDVAVYISLLCQTPQMPDSQNVISPCVANAIKDTPAFQVALDFLLSCNPNYPVPISAVEQHLKNEFYGLTDEDKSALVSHHQVEKLSWHATLVRRLANTYSGGNSDIPETAVPLPKCPLYSHEFSQDGQVLSVKLHPKVHSELEGMFYDTTIPHLVETTAQDNQRFGSSSPWNFFSGSKPASQQNASLPGVKDGYLGSKTGILQEAEFLKIMKGAQQSDLQVVSYTAYQHVVSHHHRVLEALAHDWLVHASDPAYARRVIPHIAHLLSQRFHGTCIESVSVSDKAHALSLLASFHTKLGNFELARDLQQSAASIFQKLNGFNHITVAECLMNLASVYNSSNDLHKAKDNLKRALLVYDRLSPHSNEFHAVYLANILAAMGVVQSALGEWEQSREHLEQAMELYKMIPGTSNMVIAASLPRDAASCMTDLGCVYLHLGKLAQSRKLLEGAADILERTGSYDEMARCLSALSAVHSLLGKGDEFTQLDRRITEAQKLSLLGAPV